MDISQFIAERIANDRDTLCNPLFKRSWVRLHAKKVIQGGCISVSNAVVHFWGSLIYCGSRQAQLLSISIIYPLALGMAASMQRYVGRHASSSWPVADVLRSAFVLSVVTSWQHTVLCPCTINMGSCRLSSLAFALGVVALGQFMLSHLFCRYVSEAEFSHSPITIGAQV